MCGRHATYVYWLTGQPQSTALLSVQVDVSLSNAGDEEAAAAAAALEASGGAEVASAADDVPTNRFDMVMKKTRGISVAPYGLLQVTDHVRCTRASCAQLALSQELWCRPTGPSVVS